MREKEQGSYFSAGPWMCRVPDCHDLQHHHHAYSWLIDELIRLRTLSDSQAKTIEGLRETLRGCSNFLEVFIAKGDEEGAGSMLYKEVRAALSRLSPAKEGK